jgi:hypothetical protein
MFWRRHRDDVPPPPWSENPGCFELHLIRRMNNPLFPPKRRIITTRELIEAQASDRRDLEDFQQKVADFYSAELPRPGAEHYCADLAKRFKGALELLERGTGIGAEWTTEFADLETIVVSSRAALFAHYRDHENTRQLLQRAESLSRLIIGNPVMAQAGRPDTPMIKANQEDIRAELCDDDDSLTFASEFFAGLGTSGFLERAKRILSDAVSDGYPVIEARKKLGIIEAAYERAEKARSSCSRNRRT